MRSPFIPLVLLFLMVAALPASAQSIYQYQAQQPRWISPENRTSAPGAGALENRGAKGHAFDSIPAGQSLELGRIEGSGVIRRLWMTVSDRSPRMLRALRLDIYWDGASTPAVSVPLGDFFGLGLDGARPFESELFSSPEGRSFVSVVPMPFHRGARLVVRNESGTDLDAIFYDIDYTREPVGPDALYFHASWHRQNPTTLGEDFRILPRVQGRGRYVGASIAVVGNPAYGDSWFGEGEVKVFLDGDREHPTLAGTGTEDYVGSGYGLERPYAQRNEGLLVANPKAGHWLFYRLHLPDPIYFSRDCEVRLQQIGGAPRTKVLALQKAGVPLRPVTLDPGGRAHFVQLLDDKPRALDDPDLPDGWTNFYRRDDVAATVYYYLDRPDAPPGETLAPVAQRVAGIPRTP